ncbi:ribosomal protein S27E [Caldisphaera lagunensis DSM 15908]|uniref:Small ribosomal subunit protein eS27 n=1 Tax=Caldisphaera lagunensis (strain DSM 15908 / JCM 11604 / ANMR 0165 / IC-154) TaxID=1056495 RepID=L0A9S4_CALLD|nr:30S ribosomal protein S27e [Caldisphaera lagunensis]AFZ70169.1 ribosomal protein S27E [Caldisphaera lagunensis DSM 15908]
MKSSLLRNRLLVPQPRSRFLIVECPNCGHKQIVYSHSSFSARCLSCGALLVKPTGGKAQILGKVEKILS